MTGSTGSAGAGAAAPDTRMLTALVQLRGALQEAALPLEVPGVAEARARRTQMIDQLEDYAIPRQMSAEAPLLVVVGGSTGAGKSTLVNSLVGQRVTAPGVLRPTTRSPVLVHHPGDGQWFGQDRLLPDLTRVTRSTDDPGALQLVASEAVPTGLAILDAPDVDSVEERNRALAGQLLAAADLWLFVTSAARYSDQVPWQHLKQAAERGTAVAVVLDRTPADSVPTVAAHLARMLASRGLKDSPLFTVPESPIEEGGLLDPAAVADIRGWLASLAGDAEARAAVVRQTLDGTIRTLAHRSHEVADAAEEQQRAYGDLRADVDAAYDAAAERMLADVRDGSLVRGEVLARWQDLVGTGELLRSLDQRVGRLRERVVNAVKGTPQTADRVALAVEAGAEALALEHAEAAAGAARDAWAATPAGAALLQGHGGLSRAGSDVPRRAERALREWQEEVVALVKRETSDKRANATMLTFGATGLATAASVLVLVRDAPDGPASSSTAPGRALLEAVVGPDGARRVVDDAAASLDRRLGSVLADDRRRWLEVLGGLGLSAEAAEDLRAAARRVDDRRFEQARAGADASGTGPNA
jgi:hypothetical protein